MFKFDRLSTSRVHLSKRTLGEGYIAGTGVLLGAILLGQVVPSKSVTLLWGVVWGLPAFALVGSVYWVHHLNLTSEQVWVVAEYCALGLGVGTIVLLSLALSSPDPMAATADSVLLGTTLSTVTVAGAFGGVIRCFHQSNQELQLRNTVLNRVLRHNLRNDLTVVMCLLDTIEESADQDQAETVEQAQRKIESLVDLTDKVRRASARQVTGSNPQPPVDIVAVVEQRTAKLEERHDNLDIKTDLPDCAPAYVDESFGLVVDNVIESALSRNESNPGLEIHVETDGNTVRLQFEDPSQTIPEADLSAVATGSETDLEHGGGVELWMVHWLVEANEGSVTFESDSEACHISIELDRATAGRLAK